MKRVNIKSSLIFWDIITFIVIFISTYFMFEVVIKNIISNSSNSDFYEKLDSIEAEYFNAFSYLEGKDTLIYNDYIDAILTYSTESAKSRVKYDDSVFAIITEISGMEVKSSKRNQDNFVIKLDEDLKNRLYIYAAHIPEKITAEKYLEIFNLAQTDEERSLIKKLFTIDSENEYKLAVIPTIDDRNNYYKITTARDYKSDPTVSYELDINGREYIAIVEYAKHGIVKSDNSVTYPIFIVADLTSDFYYLINKVRNTFLAILLLVFIMVVIIKLITTGKITREIGEISKIITHEGEVIRTSGLVGKDVQDISTDFIETSTLYESYANLHSRLNILGEIVSGISDRELLTAVLMETNSILDPHEEEMSVVFLDIKGFTSLTEKYQEKVFTIVNSIWMEVEQIIDKNFGKINKYIGDACLIIFQEGRGKHNSSFYALKSAIQILERVTTLRKELDVDFNFRVGVDFGKIVYGKTGTENNYELGVIGDTVNTAARLESINKQYKTNLMITETVVHRTKEFLKGLNPHLYFYKVDKVRPKGKKVPKELFTILANNGEKSRFIGNDNYVTNKSLQHIQNIMDYFTDSISLWQKYYKESDPAKRVEKHRLAMEDWQKTLFRIKSAYKHEYIPTMDKYIFRIVTINEQQEFNTDKDKWFQKKVHGIQEPSEDWIKFGFNEIEK